MTQDYKPEDNVIWTNPTNKQEFEATIEKKDPAQSRAIESNPDNPRPQGYPSVSGRERRFSIRLKETGKTQSVFISELRRPK